MIEEPERLTLGLTPGVVQFVFRGDFIYANWLGTNYSWAGLMTRGLQVNPFSDRDRACLEQATWK